MTITKCITDRFDFADFIAEITQNLTYPYDIKLDCSFLIHKPIKLLEEDSIRYIWACRSCHFNKITDINSDQNRNKLLLELAELPFDFLVQLYYSHTENNLYDTSGFIPSRLLSLVVYLTKF